MDGNDSSETSADATQPEATTEPDHAVTPKGAEGQEESKPSAADPKAQPNGHRTAKIAGGAGAGMAVAAGVALGVAELVEGGQDDGPGAGPPTIPEGSILVNGETHKIQSSDDTPLLYVLTDELGLRGPKFGCGLAQCGSCSVLVGDKEVRSCVTKWSSVKDEATTLEGLPRRWARQQGQSTDEESETLHPVQQAWIDEQVPQCGYCQNGMIMTAVDLLDQNPNPTEEQIKEAYTDKPPSPHLCRCGTYHSMMRAVRRAAEQM